MSAGIPAQHKAIQRNLTVSSTNDTCYPILTYKSNATMAEEDGSPNHIQYQLSTIDSKGKGLLLKSTFLPYQIRRYAHARVDSRPNWSKYPVGRSVPRKVELLVPVTHCGLCVVTYATDKAANKWQGHESSCWKVFRDRGHQRRHPFFFNWAVQPLSSTCETQSRLGLSPITQHYHTDCVYTLHALSERCIYTYVHRTVL